ncbi:MAG: hypothetical protein AAFS10_11755 [Myxococcota bacterium]
MWKTLVFNTILLLGYTLMSFGLAWLVAPDTQTAAIFGGALTYGCGNVHFVLWFMAYTRERQEVHRGELLEGREEELLV